MSGTQKKDVQLVKVYIRQRPLTSFETEAKRQNVVQHTSSNEILLKSGSTEKKYYFDQVFNKKSSQEEIYNVVVSPMIGFVLSGYTCTVFAYGQTGTGKTYTIVGKEVGPTTDFYNDPSIGIVPRAAIQLYAELAQLTVEHTVKVSFIEIYNEELRDLLVKHGPPLKIYDDPDNKGATCIKGVTEKVVTNVEEIYELLAIGSIERQTASTDLNRHSSRSHTLFTIVVNTREVTSNGEVVMTNGKLHMVDLAGSENIGRSGATDMRAREAGSINKSLLTLGKVIKALAQHMQHIPYRESKLTRILQDSLGGKSKTCMIATFSSCMDGFDETLSTLDYAHVARSVANCPTVNINRIQTNILKDSQKQIEQLRQELNAARAGEGFYMDPSAYEKINFDIKSKNERILILTQEIERIKRALSEKQKLYDDLSQSAEQVSSNLEDLKKVLKKQKRKIKTLQITKETMESQLMKLTQIAQELFEACETTTKQQDIFYNKYNLLCDYTCSNADAAKKINSLGVGIVNQISESAENFYQDQTTHLDEARERVKIVHDLHSKNSERLNHVLSKINLKKEDWDLNFKLLFKDIGYSEDQFQKRIMSFFENSRKARMDDLDQVEKSFSHIKDHVEEASTKIEERLKESENLINQQLARDQENDKNRKSLLQNMKLSLLTQKENLEQQLSQAKRMEELQTEILQECNLQIESKKQMLEITKSLRNDEELFEELGRNAIEQWSEVEEVLGNFNVMEPMNFLTTIIQQEINNVKESGTSCETTIEDNMYEAEKCGSGFSEIFDSKVTCNDNDFKNTLGEWSVELETIEKNLEEIRTEHIKCLVNKFKCILSAEKTHEDEVKEFIEKSTQELENLAKRIKSQVHVGDTPVKAVFEHPKVPKLQSIQNIQEHSKRLVDDFMSDSE